MKIKMTDAGESPEFGAYQAGDELDETRASLDTLKRLVERGLATDLSAPRQGRKPKEEVADNV